MIWWLRFMQDAKTEQATGDDWQIILLCLIPVTPSLRSSHKWCQNLGLGRNYVVAFCRFVFLHVINFRRKNVEKRTWKHTVTDTVCLVSCRFRSIKSWTSSVSENSSLFAVSVSSEVQDNAVPAWNFIRQIAEVNAYSLAWMVLNAWSLGSRNGHWDLSWEWYIDLSVWLYNG